jgi:hypothetical protein
MNTSGFVLGGEDFEVKENMDYNNLHNVVGIDTVNYWEHY